jgi:opacity protein-like surface antigen
MKKYSSPLLMLVLATFVMAPGWAQAGSGFYISSDIGLNVASGIDTTGRSNDRASTCDEYINPRYAEVDGLLGNDECLGPNPGEGDDWDSGFDSATGILAGAAVGYSFAGQNSSLGGLRVELEYFYRQSNYDQTNYLAGGDAGGVSGDKLGGEGDIREVVLGTDRIGSVSSHNLFANLYYDFANTSRFTPYIGIGGGLGITDMEYGSVWARNPYADRIPTGAGLPNADEIRQNLAGTVSVEDVTLSDTLWGFQFLFGVDYALTDAMSLGLKGRYVMFDSFDSGDGSLVWDPLRGHPPYLRTDGTEHVSGAVSTNNIQFFGISLNMKYHF